jgi:hypothetical protein
MLRVLNWTAVVLGVALVGVQFVPVASDPHTIATSQVHMAGMIDPPVGAILDRSCQDCHSHNTHWPWYASVAPISWILYRDVSKGRAKLDFSLWAARPHSANERMEICDAVTNGSMPLRVYSLLHPDARLSQQDVDLICDWATAPASDKHRLQAKSSDTEPLNSSDNVARSNAKGSR